MKKDDLKTGMLVQLGNDDEMLVLRDTPKGDVFVDNEGWLEFSDYNDELYHESGEDEWDIVAVFTPRSRSAMTLDDLGEDYDLIWEREERAVPELLTGEEKAILELLDEKYEYIARDKDGMLYAYGDKPIRFLTDWVGELYSRMPFDNLFEFVSWEDEEPTKISDLLD